MNTISETTITKWNIYIQNKLDLKIICWLYYLRLWRK